MQRQMSLNVGYDRISKKGKEKMRRSSSADLSSELGLIAEPSMKIMDCCPTNYDSGTEDLSQNETTVDNIAHVNNDHDEGISNTTSVTDENDDYQNQTFQPVPTDSESSLEQWGKFFLEHDISLTELEKYSFRLFSRFFLVEQAKSIDDFEKQQFCGTMEAFHAEFVINFLFPLSKTNLNLNYVLVPISDGLVPGNVYGCCVSVVENAKAQFRCSFCNRCWSSMRSRISFDMTHPNVVPGIVYMKIYGQDCDECHHLTRPLWYIGKT